MIGTDIYKCVINSLKQFKTNQKNKNLVPPLADKGLGQSLSENTEKKNQRTNLYLRKEGPVERPD